MVAHGEQHTYIEYLTAKRSIDDRSLNRHVQEQLWRQVPATPLSVVEVGAGIGTMIERLLEVELLPGGEYLAIDHDPGLIAEAKRRLRSWAGQRGVPLQEHPDGFELGAEHRLRLRWLEADVTVADLRGLGADWDLLIAHALLDLVDLESTLPRLLRLLPDSGWFWFTINFDGVTRFLPTLDPELDRRIESLYHGTMDGRTTPDGRPAGHSRTGRRLLSLLLQQGCRVAAAGASDWVIHPQSGRYRDDDATLLRYLLQTVEHALTGHPDLDHERFAGWLRARRDQLAQAELALLAHQLDLCGQRAGAYSDPA